MFKSSRNDGASEDPRLEEHGKKYKHSFYRMLGDVSIIDGLPLFGTWICAEHEEYLCC